jgi:hypothetical protein
MFRRLDGFIAYAKKKRKTLNPKIVKSPKTLKNP